MVEHKHFVMDEASDDSPPLVQAEHASIQDLRCLEPIRVSAVTIDGEQGPPYQEVSVVSHESGASARGDNFHTANDDQAWTAGIAGGVVGTLVGGPFVGLVAGGAAAYYSHEDGAAGDISRAIAEVGRTTGEKAKELNDKHHLLDKSKEAAGQAWQKVQEMNEKHQFKEKSQKAATEAWENFQEYDRKHGIVNQLSALAVLCFQKFLKLMERFSERMIEEQPAGMRSSAQTSATRR